MKIRVQVTKIIELNTEEKALLKQINDLALPLMLGNKPPNIDELSLEYAKLDAAFKEKIICYLTSDETLGNYAWESDDFVIDSNQVPKEE